MTHSWRGYLRVEAAINTKHVYVINPHLHNAAIWYFARSLMFYESCIEGNLLVWKLECILGTGFFFFWNLGQELWYSELEEGEHRRRAEAQNIGG